MTDDLDQLFAAAKVESLQPSDRLMARVLADGIAAQPKPAVVQAKAPAPPVRQGFWAMLSEAVGGRGVLAGIGTVAAASLMIGYFQPTSLSMVTGGLYDTPLEAVDMVPSLDGFLTEG